MTTPKKQRKRRNSGDVDSAEMSDQTDKGAAAPRPSGMQEGHVQSEQDQAYATLASMSQHMSTRPSMQTTAGGAYPAHGAPASLGPPAGGHPNLLMTRLSPHFMMPSSSSSGEGMFPGAAMTPSLGLLSPQHSGLPSMYHQSLGVNPMPSYVMTPAHQLPQRTMSGIHGMGYLPQFQPVPSTHGMLPNMSVMQQPHFLPTNMVSRGQEMMYDPNATMVSNLAISHNAPTIAPILDRGTSGELQQRQPSPTSSSNSSSAASLIPSKRTRPQAATSEEDGGGKDADFNGEGRLSIAFESFGELTDHPPPKIGQKGVIPNGISGAFSSYGERWHFQVRYSETKASRSRKIICIEWLVRNNVWEDYHSVIETMQDAIRREERGITLCNKVFTEALEMRAKQYEAELEEQKSQAAPNQLRIANLISRIKTLRPKRISEGPLLFGLRHRIVQDKFSTTEGAKEDDDNASQ